MSCLPAPALLTVMWDSCCSSTPHLFCMLCLPAALHQERLLPLRLTFHTHTPVGGPPHRSSLQRAPPLLSLSCGLCYCLCQWNNLCSFLNALLPQHGSLHGGRVTTSFLSKTDSCLLGRSIPMKIFS